MRREFFNAKTRRAEEGREGRRVGDGEGIAGTEDGIASKLASHLRGNGAQGATGGTEVFCGGRRTVR